MCWAIVWLSLALLLTWAVDVSAFPAAVLSAGILLFTNGGRS
jgi:hypothetical protein